MKWGRKKSSWPAVHCQSLIARVFRASWLIKFKQNGDSFEHNSADKKQRSKLNPPSPRSLECASWTEGRFRNMDTDVYWKLLFGEEGSGINSVRYLSDDELGYPTKTTREDDQQFNDMSLDLKKMQYEMRNMWESHASRDKRGNGKARKDLKSRILEEKEAENKRAPPEEQKISKIVEKDIFEIEDFCPNSTPSKIEEQEESSKEKINDIAQNSVPRRKSAYIRGDSPTKKNSTFKVYSPTKESKIRALEDTKKARSKPRKKTREKAAESSSIFDNFAVVKYSFAPEQDFRDSMVEMIREKGIRRPDELEELLACYLTLNSDEYHDLIIQVFQQVWLFEVKQEFIDLEMGNDNLI